MDYYQVLAQVQDRWLGKSLSGSQSRSIFTTAGIFHSGLFFNPVGSRVLGFYCAQSLSTNTDLY